MPATSSPPHVPPDGLKHGLRVRVERRGVACAEITQNASENPPKLFIRECEKGFFRLWGYAG